VGGTANSSEPQGRVPRVGVLLLHVMGLGEAPCHLHPCVHLGSRSEFSQAPSGTQGSAKLLRKLRGEESQAEESEGDGRAAGKARPRLPCTLGARRGEPGPCVVAGMEECHPHG